MPTTLCYTTLTARPLKSLGLQTQVLVLRCDPLMADQTRLRFAFWGQLKKGKFT
jgi:hypothetical protein